MRLLWFRGTGQQAALAPSSPLRLSADMAETTTSGARERIDTDAQAAALIHKMRGGERRATALVITELERLSTAAPILLRAMQPHLGHALVVGFTGPPD